MFCRRRGYITSATQATDGMEMFSVLCVLFPSLVSLYFDDMTLLKPASDLQALPRELTHQNIRQICLNIF